MRPDLSFSSEGPLNVLLFTADDLDRNSLGCYGSGVPEITPNLDRFAGEGMRFNLAYVNNSICVPSRANLATGLYGHNNGVTGFMKMPQGSPHPLIMEILRDHGYRVGVMSKVGHSTPKQDFRWDYVLQHSDLGFGRNPDLYYQGVKAFLQDCRENGKPFYLMVNSDDPHRPFFNPSEPVTRGQAVPSRLYSPEEIEVPGFLPDLPGVREEVSYYFNSVRRLDDTFGKVMQALEEEGYLENTLVVFISDNGVVLPFAKCDNYHASSRTPWLVRWPGVVEPGSVDDAHYISAVDFMPTVLDAMGVSHPEKLDGVSHLALYRGKRPDRKNRNSMVYTQIDSKAGGASGRLGSIPMRGVQDREYLYIYNAWSDGKRLYANNNEGMTMLAMEKEAEINPEMAERVAHFRYRVPEEFYDLQNDPECLENLYGNPAYKRKIKRMQRSLIRFMKRTDDPLMNVFINRDDTEYVKDNLYELYPQIRAIDEKFFD